MPKLTKEAFSSYLLGFLAAFNNEGIDPLTEDTILGDVLQNSTEKATFKNAVILTQRNAEFPVKKFPKDHLALSLKEFISTITILLVFVSVSFGQMKINIGKVETGDRFSAITFGVSYAVQADSSWKTREVYFAGKQSILTIAPEFDIQTGTKDAFSWYNFKLTGLFSKFQMQKDSASGIQIPDLKKNVQNFPVSIGAEANSTFSTINSIVEVGYSPFYQSATGNTPAFLKATRIGFYLQGGYKFKTDSAAAIAWGGKKDESLEKVNSALARAKASFSIDSKKLITLQGLNVGVVGNVDVWYDFVNQAVYHRLQGIAKVYLIGDQSIDFSWSKGSGAPNFNSMDQYGVGLTITF